MTTDSLRNVKDRFSEFADRVDREHERIVVTRNVRPATASCIESTRASEPLTVLRIDHRGDVYRTT
jgi:PHD/YefM family antitoxin component YafN of YafNO toxin-antitoxin module